MFLACMLQGMHYAPSLPTMSTEPADWSDFELEELIKEDNERQQGFQKLANKCSLLWNPATGKQLLL